MGKECLFLWVYSRCTCFGSPHSPGTDTESAHPADLAPGAPQEHPQLMSLCELRRVSQQILDHFKTKRVRAQRHTSSPALPSTRFSSSSIKRTLLNSDSVTLLSLMHCRGLLVPPPSCRVLSEGSKCRWEGHHLGSDHCTSTAASQPWSLSLTSKPQAALTVTCLTEKLHFSCF